MKIETVKIGGKEKEAKLALIAAPDAKPFNGPVQIVVADLLHTNVQRNALFELGPKESRSGEMLINATDQLWLTVTTNTPASTEKEKAK